jgi:hypothetical protein
MNTFIKRNYEDTPAVETFIEWVSEDLTEAEANMILGYIEGHGYRVSRDETGEIILVDNEEPENGIVARGYEELLDRINAWNFEFIQDAEVVGAQREQALKDMEMIDGLLCDARHGLPIGTPTVKELIAILSKLPEDYRVTCCGAENYLYLWTDKNAITIDCERYLG